MKRLDRWLLNEYAASTQDLGIYRIVYASYLILCVGAVGLWVPNVPPIAFDPPLSIAAMSLSYPSPTLLRIGNLLLCLSATLLLVGWKTPLASLATAFLFVFLKSWTCATGKINHDIFIALVPLALAFSGWGQAFSIDGEKKSLRKNDPVAGYYVAALALFISFAMFKSGLGKLQSYWWHPEKLSTYTYLLKRYSVVGHQTLLAEQLLRFPPGLVWKFFDYLTLAVELGFAVAFFRRRWFVLFCALACVFHLGISLLLNISFAQNIVAYAVLIPYSKIRLGKELRKVPRQKLITLLFTFAASALLIRKVSWTHVAYLTPAIIVLGGLVGMYYLAITVQSEIFRKRFGK